MPTGATRAVVIPEPSILTNREPMQLSLVNLDGSQASTISKQPAQMNSTAATLDDLLADFNSLLETLRQAGIIAIPQPVASGLRAAPNTVGYIGSGHPSDRILNIGDTIPSELSGCVWDDTVFRVNSSNLVIDNWQINAGIDCYGTNLTVTNCLILPPADSAFYGVLLRHGTLTIMDTTVMGAGGTFEQGNAISNDDAAGIINAIRCAAGGFQDAFGITHGLISQCWVHDVALAGSFHSDGIQVFGHAANDVTIQHCYIDITGPDGQSTDDEHQNACVYADLPSGPVNGLIVDNCYLVGGAYEIMLSAAPQDISIVNCNFGPVDSHGLGEITITSGTEIVEWSNNYDDSGSLMSEPTA